MKVACTVRWEGVGCSQRDITLPTQRLVAHQHYYALIALFLALKTVGVGLTAFLFGALRPKLMQIAWFVWIYDRVLRIRHWAEIQVRPTMARIRAMKHAMLAALPRGLALRRARRIRRRMNRVQRPLAH